METQNEIVLRLLKEVKDLKRENERLVDRLAKAESLLESWISKAKPIDPPKRLKL